PWVCSAYYRPEADAEKAGAVHEDGWLDTGDIATIDADGYVQITDRKKDLIKSGGEWISSILLENLAVSHPHVAQAAAIAVPDEKWGERPLLIAVAENDCKPDKQSILDHLATRLAKWQMPDDIVFVDALPLGATGKVLKKELRKTYG
ncbi:MAG: AMP-binding enzyme, partial [Alphaproteobacteria bacterium]